MKTIAIDIDDVLALSAEGFVRFSNETWGTKLKQGDYDEHWAKLWKISNEEVEQRANYFHEVGAAAAFKPIDDGVTVLHELKKRFKLAIVTSRRLQIRYDTINWINTYYPELFSEVHFAGIWDNITDKSIHMTKQTICKDIGADYLIDDQIKHCFAAAEAGIETVLFGVYEWNKWPNLPLGVTRCANWKEVLDYFESK